MTLLCFSSIIDNKEMVVMYFNECPKFLVRVPSSVLCSSHRLFSCAKCRLQSSSIDAENV